MTFATAWTEEQLLDEFWKAQGDLAVDRLQLLRLYAMVTLRRPADWNPSAIREQFELSKGARRHPLGCFSCFSRSRRLHWHHVIQIQHGGSNAERNFVSICDSAGELRGASCHQTLHLWMHPSTTSHETTRTSVDAYVAALGIAMTRPFNRSLAAQEFD